MEIKASILDYIGKIDKGILVLVSLVFENKYYEGMFFYTDEHILINVDDNLEEAIGCKIENHKEYADILRFLIKNVVPWSEMLSRIDDVDFSAFEQIKSQTVQLGIDVDPSEVTSATQS